MVPSSGFSNINWDLAKNGAASAWQCTKNWYWSDYDVDKEHQDNGQGGCFSFTSLDMQKRAVSLLDIPSQLLKAAEGIVLSNIAIGNFAISVLRILGASLAKAIQLGIGENRDWYRKIEGYRSEWLASGVEGFLISPFPILLLPTFYLGSRTIIIIGDVVGIIAPKYGSIIRRVDKEFMMKVGEAFKAIIKTVQDLVKPSGINP